MFKSCICKMRLKIRKLYLNIYIYMINSSNSSKVKSGNTSQISPSKHWIFTLNNYTQEDIRAFTESDSSIVPQFCFQEEVGESGTPHLQGYLAFTTKKRPFSVFKTKRIHWEKCRNIKASISYCQKNDTCTGQKFFRNIIRPYTVSIPKMYYWQKDIIKLLKGPVNDRTLYWYYEKVGCTGKTTLQKYIFLNFPHCLIVSGKAADMKHAVVKYIETNNMYPQIILANIPRSSLDYISYAGIEDVKDMFFHSGKYEGGQVCGPSPHFFLFANERPDTHAVSKDRWIIHQIRKKKQNKSDK